MKERDKIYLSMLEIRLPLVRDLAFANDLTRCGIEADHLHNMPSLIGEANFSRHVFYFNKERVHYIDACRNCDKERGGHDCMIAVKSFVPYWEKLIELLREEKGDIET